MVDLGDPDGGAVARSIKLDAEPPLVATQRAVSSGSKMLGLLGSFLFCPFLFDEYQHLKTCTPTVKTAESTVSSVFDTLLAELW